MFIIIALIISFVILSSVNSLSHELLSVSQQQAEANALCGFKQGITNWPGKCHATGWDCSGSNATSFPCGAGSVTWTGIYCDTNIGAVNYISIVACGLTGTISSTLGTLTDVGTLYLYDNELAGSLPSELSSLNQVDEMYLYNNKLIGTIPSEFSGLTFMGALSLYNNLLTGQIPNAISSMGRLHDLYLNNNLFSGSIPTVIGTMSRLNILGLNDNKLSSSIPPEITDMPNLSIFNVTNNNLQGPVGSQLCDNPELAFIYLDNNNFTCIAECVAKIAGPKNYDQDTPVTKTCGQNVTFSPTLIPTAAPFAATPTFLPTPSPTTAQAPTDDDNSSSSSSGGDKKVSDGAVAGVIIGVIAFLGISGFVVYKYLLPNWTKKQTISSPTTIDAAEQKDTKNPLASNLL